MILNVVAMVLVLGMWIVTFAESPLFENDPPRHTVFMLTCLFVILWAIWR